MHNNTQQSFQYAHTVVVHTTIHIHAGFWFIGMEISQELFFLTSTLE